MKRTIKTFLVICLVTILGFGLSGCDNANQRQAKDLDATITSFVNTTSSLDWADASSLGNTNTSETSNNARQVSTSTNSSVAYDVTNIQNSLEDVQGRISKIIGKRATLSNYINDLNTGRIKLSSADENAINAYKNIIKENTSYLSSNNGTIRNTVNSITSNISSNPKNNLINAYVIRSNEIISTRCAKIDAAYEAMTSIETILQNAKNGKTKTTNNATSSSKTTNTNNSNSSVTNNEQNSIYEPKTLEEPIITDRANNTQTTNNNTSSTSNTTNTNNNVSSSNNYTTSTNTNSSTSSQNSQSNNTSTTVTRTTVPQTRRTYPMTRNTTNNRYQTRRNRSNISTYTSDNNNTTRNILPNSRTRNSSNNYNTSINNIRRQSPIMQTSDTSGYVVNTNNPTVNMPYTNPVNGSNQSSTNTNQTQTQNTNNLVA